MTDMVSDPIQILIQRLTELGSASPGGSTTSRLGQIVVRQEAIRLVHRLDTVASGAFVTRDPMDIAALVESVSRAGKGTPCTLTVSDSLLHKLAEPSRSETLSLLWGILDSDETPVQGDVRILASSALNPAQDPKLLRVLARAVARGMKVGLVVSTNEERAVVSLALTADSGSVLVKALLTDDVGGAAWIVELEDGERSPSVGFVKSDPMPVLPVIPFSLPSTSFDNADESRSRLDATFRDGAASITDLFGSLISLRDLEPRAPDVRGLGKLREELGLSAPFVPRKNDREYASVVASFAQDVAGSHPQIIYVGDTLFNDGTAICNLADQAAGSVHGFLCNERGFGVTDDFTIGPVYFANRWRSLDRFLGDARRKGLTIDENTVGFFDLDQTVYAAKGRDDEPLLRARWKALLSYLRDNVPPNRFDPEHIERIYRHLDQDAYHRITRDNMDYVALFVLAIAAGLCDSSELEEFAASGNNSIASLTERLYQRARFRLDHAEIDHVMDEIRRVYFNTLAGDQTPCKEYRRYECAATAAAMKGLDDVNRDARIVFNREVIDFIHFLRDRGAHVFALSDRPVEAAVIENDDVVVEDLMSIRMAESGIATYSALEEAAR